MSTYKQVREIIDRLRQYYRELHEYYEEASDDTPDERLKVLLDYMGRHERNINRALQKYEATAADGVLDTWVQFVADEKLQRAFAHAELDADTPPDQVIENALDVDRALVEVYEQLANYTNSPRIEELFESLLEMEKGKDFSHARGLLELRDQQ